jgi:lipoprotein-anchoring transpeptidase ErfK/SrfK
MAAFRSLGFCYLSAASVFVLAATLSAHRAGLDAFSRQTQTGLQRSLQDFFRTGPSYEPAAHLELAPPGAGGAHIPPRLIQAPAVTVSPPAIDMAAIPLEIAPDLPQAAGPENDTAPTRPRALTVAARLKDMLAPDLFNNFSLFLYVSTAPKGPLAQRLYVFVKDGQGGLTPLYDWAASTGRSRAEISPRGRHAFTATPTGYYELDPRRMYKSYFSRAWNGAMPYAMFFNREKNGQLTGVAIHSATGDDIARLGSRASAGCIHLSPEHARQLYNLIRGQYRGPMPRFAYDPATRTMSNNRDLMRGADGKLQMADGYRVITLIENFSGREFRGRQETGGVELRAIRRGPSPARAG